MIAPGATVELSSAYSGDVSFAGDTGTLKIDNSSSFTGTITGQLAIGDVIDLADITAGADAKISYTGNNSPGTLTVSDGTPHGRALRSPGIIPSRISRPRATAMAGPMWWTRRLQPWRLSLDANGFPSSLPRDPSSSTSPAVREATRNGLTPGYRRSTIAEGQSLLHNSSDHLLLKAVIPSSISPSAI